LLKTYKFHLTDTKRTSSKTRCDQVLSLGRNTFLRGQDFNFYYMFKTNFSGRNIIWEHCPRIPPLAKRLPVKQKFHTLDENTAALCFWLNSSKSDDLRTIAFSTSTKCKSHEKYILVLLVTIVATLQDTRVNAYLSLIPRQVLML